MTVPPADGGVPGTTPDTPRNRFALIVMWTMETAAVVLMSAVAIFVFANAVGRYFFSAPLPWTEELVVNLLVWLAAVGVTIAAIRGHLVTCDIVTTRLRSQRTRRILAIVCALIGSATMLYCSWLAIEYLLTFWARPSLLLGIPRGVPIVALLLAFLGIAVASISSIVSRG